MYEEPDLSQEEFSELEDLDDKETGTGDYILVRLAGKKSFRYFIAEVIVVHADFYEVKYLKRVPNSEKFMQDSEAVYELEKGDILKFPHPNKTGRSAHQLQKLSFGVDLSSYNVQ